MINLNLMLKGLNKLNNVTLSFKEQAFIVQKCLDLVSLVSVWGDWDEEIAMINALKESAVKYPELFKDINFN